MATKLEKARDYLDRSYDLSKELSFVALRAAIRCILEYLEEAEG